MYQVGTFSPHTRPRLTFTRSQRQVIHYQSCLGGWKPWDGLEKLARFGHRVCRHNATELHNHAVRMWEQVYAGATQTPHTGSSGQVRGGSWPAPGSAQVLVLGPHHSGTSFTTRAMMEMGFSGTSKGRFRQRGARGVDDGGSFEAGADVDGDSDGGASRSIDDELLMHDTNPMKYWEHRDVVALNQYLFDDSAGHIGTHSGVLIGAEGGTALKGTVDQLVGQSVERASVLAKSYPWAGYGYSARAPPTEWSERAASVVKKLDAHRPWVTKDPRLALTVHAWMPLLDTQNPLSSGVLCVVTYRHPLSFASSMLK